MACSVSSDLSTVVQTEVPNSNGAQTAGDADTPSIETGPSSNRKGWWMPSENQQQQSTPPKTTPEQKNKKRSSTRIRTKFQIEALTVELSKLRQENQFLKETWHRIQQTKQPKSNKHIGGDNILKERMRELHLDQLEVPQELLSDNSSDREDIDLSDSERSPRRKQYNEDEER
mmetsp:Transcript_25382/g.32483  ORF Transcript_25382/g.32483 Transcript_25382/m.32483 type:complete len:173 (+) Transcript_25382:144-662(+)